MLCQMCALRSLTVWLKATIIILVKCQTTEAWKEGIYLNITDLSAINWDHEQVMYFF